MTITVVPPYFPVKGMKMCSKLRDLMKCHECLETLRHCLQTVEKIFLLLIGENCSIAKRQMPSAQKYQYYPTVRACAVGITNLHTSSVLYQYRGTAQLLCSWFATTCTTRMLLERQALTLRTPRVVGLSLVPDPNQVSKISFPGLESD